MMQIYGLALIIWGMVDKITVADSPTSTVVIWMGVGIASMANAAMGLYGTKIDDKCLVYAVPISLIAQVWSPKLGDYFQSIVFMFTSCVVQIVVTIIRVSMPLKETDAERKQLFRLFNEEDEEYLERFYQMQIDVRKLVFCLINTFVLSFTAGMLRGDRIRRLRREIRSASARVSFELLQRDEVSLSDSFQNGLPPKGDGGAPSRRINTCDNLRFVFWLESELI